VRDRVRIDKWLWAVRLYKTRNKATEACKKGRIIIGDLPVKPSREIQSGEIVKIKRPPITRSYKILSIAEKRMSASKISEFVEEVTPDEEIELLNMQKHMRVLSRKPGAGRPTKKERRDMDSFFDRDLSEI